MNVILLYFEGCPNWETTDARLRALGAEFPGIEVTLQAVETPEEAERVGFRGSPSILIDGADPFPGSDAPIGLSCRVYRTPDGPAGSPTMSQLREVLGHA